MCDFSGKCFYHIYPLGFCGAPARNDFACPAGGGLLEIASHAERLAALGVNALYIGPLFESESHGYDTVDYFYADRRLGNNAALKEMAAAFHKKGIAVVLDAVFNHTGREFFAFKDVREKREASIYKDWYLGVDFSKNNSFNDGFRCENWAGHDSLAKLNLANPAVREHLFSAAEMWINEFEIDGLRLDAANVMSEDFLRALALRTKAAYRAKTGRSDFWLMGEIVAGDYRRIANEKCLDSATNYELSKSLWSAFADKNFFELAWTLKREFNGKNENLSGKAGLAGMYADLFLYNFADNHDVDRVASSLKKSAHLFPLYGMLFSVPGIPSIYYGSEYGVKGRRTRQSDASLRPRWNGGWAQAKEGRALADAIARFARIRKESEALRRGGYRELLVKSEQFAFARETTSEKIAVAANASDREAEVALKPVPDGVWRCLLDGTTFRAEGGTLKATLFPNWLRILRHEGRAL